MIRTVKLTIVSFDLEVHMVIAWESDFHTKWHTLKSSHPLKWLSQSVLEITVSHWPFSDQFQDLAKQNPFWLAKFTVYFQWDSNQKLTKCPIFKKQPTNF